MSRSRRKTPICGITTAASDPFSEPHHFREFCNDWLMHKDGKYYWGPEHSGAKWLRK